MVFQSVCLLVPTYRRLQIVLCVILLCDVNSSTIPSGADKESTGGSGNIVYEGFWLKMASQTKEEAKRTYEEDLEGLFRVCDKNADGFMDHDELYYVIKDTGRPFTEEDIHDIMRQCDKNNDEWVKMMEKVQ
ncbi:troponin C, skeletal muscle-like isoform X1 [Stegostoma tigrinum]|uniref:troponin C, skeletal muscle-like isoform X1 n=1 Tax=Stegostoma tigrinum TaxID=3053191 RepID=UPI00202B0353|nr:troponin C, skeletal muscle-like isoform X1 [Stegostoma tigrinum]